MVRSSRRRKVNRGRKEGNHNALSDLVTITNTTIPSPSLFSNDVPLLGRSKSVSHEHVVPSGPSCHLNLVLMACMTSVKHHLSKREWKGRK
jgi:hypothetical protein